MTESAIPPTPEKRQPSVSEQVGESALSIFQEIKAVALLLSESIYYSTLAVRRPKTLTRGSTATQMIQLGSTALPIVLLLSTLIGLSKERTISWLRG